MSTTAPPLPPAPPEAAARPRPRRRLVIWGGLAALVLVAVGVTWLLGGFDGKATPYLGPQAELGESIETRFWDVEVIDAYVEPGETKISAKLNVTNKTERHTTQLTSEIVLIRIEETGEVLGTTYCDFHTRTTFNPLVSTGAICHFDYEYNEITDPPTEDFAARVIVLDQEIRENLLTAPEPAAGEVVANVPIEVRHLPEEEQ
ncbi:hypothetical protein FOJ82_09820 [Tessaracoccus rhinocerotis]|uniref:Uncharacterized protein n=1 Tax=Tessaracoccus rhinocerotis TaxID=1689449 RepID=A0A553K0U6_9ACTN|nr:hypothetical protein [Tessaracoccus rhinocerotis]TRY18317.1 hypothetical protein FOJ82_09820 [Tessaracoccus rhinocerotis]